MENEIFLLLKKIILEREDVGQDISMDSKLIDLGIDSVVLMDIIIKVEDQYNKPIDFMEVLNYLYGDITIGMLVKCIMTNYEGQ